MAGRTGVVVQIRSTSSRLPGKAFAPLAGATLTHHVLRALRAIPADAYVVATDQESAASLRPIAEEEGFSLYPGPSEDVLLRYIEVGREYELEYLIRATGDNPLVSPRLAIDILNIHQNQAADLSHFISCPLGTGVEVVRQTCLVLAHQRSGDPYEREHITTFLYRHPRDFKIVEEECPPECRLPGVKVSVDTEADLSSMRRIFDALYDGDPIETPDLVAWLVEGAST